MLHYILLIITFLFLFFFAYIKLKYPFWNNQPVYHVYDFIRHLCREPFIVNKNTPVKTKYYDPEHVYTVKYIECSQNTKKDLLNMIQCFYLNTDRILYTLNESDIYAMITGQVEPSYVSIFYEKQYSQIVDLSGSQIKGIFTPVGAVISKSLMFWYADPNTKYQNYTEMPLYCIDFLCVDRKKDRTNIYLKLFQTHEYN